jgi:polyferredoxin
MNDPFDDTLHAYFKKHKTETADDGFSRKIINKLPLMPKYTWILYIAYFMGLVVFFALNPFYSFITQVMDFVTKISFFHAPSTVSIVAFLSVCFLFGLFVKISFDESVI